MTRTPIRPAGLIAFALIIAAFSAGECRLSAQPKAPSPITVAPQAPTLAAPFPLGVQRGTSLELTLTGGNLSDPTAVWLSFPAKATILPEMKDGKEVKDPAKLKVKLEVPADAPIGFHTIRVATKQGISNSRVFCVDELPQVNEVDTNRKKETAQPVPVPCVVVGRTDPEISDFFKVSVKAGQHLSFEVLGHRLGSPIDPIIVLHDAKSGREMPGLYSDDAPGLQTDARLSHTFKEAGDYVVEVRDTTHRGGADYYYRLRIGEFPLALTPWPLALKRSTKAQVGFTGPDVEGVAPVEVAAPADPAVPVVYATPRRPGGVAGWPVPVLLTDFDQAAEQEPNNEPAKANRVPVPGGVTGRFLDKGDVDHFVFAAKKGMKYAITAETYDVGSPAEVYLTLKKPGGAEVAKSNPQQPTARIDFTADADGDHIVSAEHLNYVHGPNEVYYLTVRAAEPDFEVHLGLERFELAPGGTALIPVMAVVRRDYPGPIELSIVGHPGMSGSVTIPAGATAPPPNVPLALALLPLTAKPDVPAGAYELRVQAKANINGKDVVRLATVADVVKVNMGGLPFPPREMLTGLGVAITAKPVFALAVKLPQPEVIRGVPVNLTVTAAREDGFADAITLAAANLPPGVTAAVKPIAAKTNEVQFPLTVPANVPLGTFTITFRGTGKHQGKDFAFYSGAVPVSVVVPLEVKLEPSPLPIKPGAKAKFKVTATRKGGYAGPIDVELKNLPANVTAPKVTIAMGQTSAEVEVTAAANAAAGDKADVNAVGTATGAANQQATSPNVTLRVEKAEPKKEEPKKEPKKEEPKKDEKKDAKKDEKKN